MSVHIGLRVSNINKIIKPHIVVRKDVVTGEAVRCCRPGDLERIPRNEKLDEPMFDSGVFGICFSLA